MLDDELLDRLQCSAFSYFVDETNSRNGQTLSRQLVTSIPKRLERFDALA